MIDYKAAGTFFRPAVVTKLAEPELVCAPGSFTGDAQALAKLVLKQIENHPEHFDMGGWIVTNDEGRDHDESDRLVPVCGTTLCVAGYVQLFTRGHIDDSVIEEQAAKALELSAGDALDLFFGDARDAVETLREIADGTFQPRHGADVDCVCARCSPMFGDF